MKSSDEVVDRFREAGLQLCATLEAMLREEPVHRTSRRGCGYTQATRYLAARINEHRSHDDFQDLCLFRSWRSSASTRQLERALRAKVVTSWRGWDINPPESLAVRVNDDPAAELIRDEASRQAALRRLPSAMVLEESRLIATLIRDIVLPGDYDASLIRVSAWPARLEVGSCPTAEKYFLELAHGFVPRKGVCNLLVDDGGATVLVEKINMGDDHSCISLVSFVLNDVRIPAGSLIAVNYDEKKISSSVSRGPFPGRIIPLGECDGVRMLRLTTLAISSDNRARAFSAHFDAQVAEGLFEPEHTSLHQLRDAVSRKNASNFVS